MANSSNFIDAMRKAGKQDLVGPNVVANALPYVGGGLILTAIGTYGGLGVLNTNPATFLTTFWLAIIVEFALFFVVRGIAEKENNNFALPLLSVYSLLSGYTLSGLVWIALSSSSGIQGVCIAAFGCGVTFIAARSIGSNLSDTDGMALMKTVRIGMIALIVVLVAQLGLSLFGFGTPTFLEVAISAAGVFIFAGAAVVDFYVLPRAYRDEQYLSAALSMYLTYINLFIFLLRLIIILSGGSRD
ncbi:MULTISPECIES: Bax inhibitor-1 family protein [Spirulina sp. CCY15215]|uniref:Bax inhibitor-1/YccA family protein n=1 Tax=Spirulina sp. CCY15215 TaxID=2767591 RepID=UPI001950531C|nr:Bax inhibitor-1 family protein [Spirulina major]